MFVFIRLSFLRSIRPNCGRLMVALRNPKERMSLVRGCPPASKQASSEAALGIAESAAREKR